MDNAFTVEAPALVGIGAESIVNRAKSLGLTWTLRPATVVSIADSSSPTGAQIIYDQDTEPVNCFSLAVGVVIGDRVMGLMVPPSGNYIIGPLANDDWHPFVFQNGWSNAGGTEVTCQFRKVWWPPNGLQLVGEMVAGTVTNGTIITTLPAGYRPKRVTSFPIAVNPSPVLPVVGPLLQLFPSGLLAIFGATIGGTVYFSVIVPLDAF